MSYGLFPIEVQLQAEPQSQLREDTILIRGDDDSLPPKRRRLAGCLVQSFLSDVKLEGRLAQQGTTMDILDINTPGERQHAWTCFKSWSESEYPKYTWSDFNIETADSRPNSIYKRTRYLYYLPI